MWVMKKRLLFRYIGDEQIPSHIGILIDHSKDPYETTSIMESKTVFFVAHITWDLFFFVFFDGLDPMGWKSPLKPAI